MGVVNVTPDSFSDGGDFASAEAAASQAQRLLAEGADIVDIGGESTRPGSRGVTLEAELSRVVPVFDKLKGGPAAALSIDTTKAGVARACLQRGAQIVNDVSAGRLDAGLFGEVAAAGAYLVLMHMKGTPRTMQESPHYADVVGEVLHFLGERAEAAQASGVASDRIIVDPGIGFGKTLEHNLALLRAVPRLKSLGFPVLVGASRKSLFNALSGLQEPKARDEATAQLTAALAAQGVDIVRVHEVPQNLRAARLGDALRPAP